jgi:hypothetical protein
MTTEEDSRYAHNAFRRVEQRVSFREPLVLSSSPRIRIVRAVRNRHEFQFAVTSFASDFFFFHAGFRWRNRLAAQGGKPSSFCIRIVNISVFMCHVS